MSQATAPVDPIECFHCQEVITGPDAKWVPYVAADGSYRIVARHWECAARSLIGGLNHLQGRCTCCGGTEDPDPPNMTRRQAAVAAVTYWKRQHWNDECCHKTRLVGAPCPIGWKCPYIPETAIND
jgi:hypothetical protein